jgi:DNA polymerase-3 subunit alpha (Gram-positive type)
MGFGDLITLSGLTHGTDVYYNNAQDLIKDGVASIREVIGCRDDIMRYLISKKMDESLSFKIMESVRKGKGLTDEWEEEMVKFNVPEWYIWSCKQIKYMFPRAHAAAYVLDATRIGYYKAYYPLEFYAAVFSSRYSDEDLINFMGSAEDIKARMKEAEGKIAELKKRGEENAAGKVDRTRGALNIALEASLRGISFGTIELYSSHRDRYLVNEETKTLIPPFTSIVGLGATVAAKLFEERNNGVFKGVRDLKKRTKANETTILVLDDLGCLDEVKELQPTLF